MLRPVSFAMCVLMLVLWASCSHASTNLWIIWGQSNTEYGQSFDLPAMAASGVSCEIPSNVQYYTDNDVYPGIHQLLSFDEQAIFGPEVGLIPLISSWTPGSMNIVLKVSRGSTAMDRWTKGGDLYALLLSDIQYMLNLYPGAKVKGIFSVQGESDATWDGFASCYFSRMQAMIYGLRTDLKSNKIPFFIVLTNPANTSVFPCGYYVNLSQLRLERLVPNVWVVPNWGLTKINDNLHYDSPSEYVLGTYMAYSWSFSQ